MFEDRETIVKILFILLLVGGSIVKMLYNAFGKTRPRAPPGPQGGTKPALDLRDFLEEVRRQSTGEGAGKARGGGREARPAAAPEAPAREEEPQWEVLEPQPERPQPAAPPARATEEAQQRGQTAKAEERHRKRARKKRQEQRGAVKRDSSKPTPVAEEREDRHIHEYFEKLSATTTQVPRDQAWGGREGSRSVASSRGVADHDARKFPPLPVLGCSLREAVIAQVILSPPRCRQRSYRRR